MKRVLLLGLLLVGTFSSAFGSGLIILHDDTFWRYPEPPFVPPLPHPHPRPTPSWMPIELSSTQIRAGIKDQVATSTIEQEFYNPNSRQLEGTFLFPIPKGA